jgi:hypothetical protein
VFGVNEIVNQYLQHQYIRMPGIDVYTEASLIDKLLYLAYMASSTHKWNVRQFNYGVNEGAAPTATQANKDANAPMDTQTWARPAVIFINFLNFACALVFTSILLHQALEVGIYKDDVLHTHRTCILAQTNNTALTGTPTQTPDFFTTVLMGAVGTPIEVLYNETQHEHFEHFPRLWQYFNSDAVFNLTKIHSQFLTMVALWISGGYALCTTRLSVFMRVHTIPFYRIYLVSLWNAFGAFIIVLLFLSPRGWGQIPLSNFLVGLSFLLLGWVYQFFYMVEIDKDIIKGNNPRYENEFTWVRRLTYLEFATTVPLYLVAAVAPGAEGIDQWRIQTTLFCSYTFFSILGLIERWKHLGHETAYDTYGSGQTKEFGQAPVNTIAVLRKNNSATWYLVYAAAMCVGAIINALSREIWWAYYSYFLGKTILARFAIVYTLVVMGVIVLAFVVGYAFETISQIGGEKTNMGLKKYLYDYIPEWTSSLLHAEALVILGSFVMKFLFFFALVNASELTKSEAIYL